MRGAAPAMVKWRMTLPMTDDVPRVYVNHTAGCAM